MKGNCFERFAAKIDFSGECWLWQAASDNAGYGNFFFNGRVMLAHRVAHLMFIGGIPDGYEVDHLCRVHNCVLPEHLEAVTRQENNARAGLRGAALVNSERTHCSRGHPLTGPNLYYDSNKRRCRACHRRICTEGYSRKKTIGVGV